jgi:hypothetical protein
MLVDDQFRKCVVFICAEHADPNTGAIVRVPKATAFLVGMPRETGNEAYAVTARHNLYSARYESGGLYLRFNLIEGGFVDIELPPDSWTAHFRTDLAATRVRPPDGSDMRLLPYDRLASSEYVRENRIGEGDQLFVVGLFPPYAGSERSQPIVRLGNVALMPREPVPLLLDPASRDRVSVDAYLIQLHSWGGQSGSPAFIYYPPDREEGFLELHEYGESRIHLLGLVQGHFEIPRDVQFTGDHIGAGEVAEDSGLAAVIPASFIRELLLEVDVAR